MRKSRPLSGLLVGTYRLAYRSDAMPRRIIGKYRGGEPQDDAGVPPEQPWMWTIIGAVVMPRLPSHGFCASLEEAKAKLAEMCARGWRLIRGLDSCSGGMDSSETNVRTLFILASANGRGA